MKNIKLFCILFICLVFLSGCVKKTKDRNLGINFGITGNVSETLDNKYDTNNPLVAMKLANYGAIVIELYPDVAPNTVNNFLSLAKSGFYDSNSFHSLIPGFALQGGDPTGMGIGDAGYHIQGEFSNNHFKNDLKHSKGVISMARSDLPNSASCQFFIVLANAYHLDGEYAAFGKVIDGWDIIEEIENNETIADSSSGKLQDNIVIEKTLVSVKGSKYPDVEKI